MPLFQATSVPGGRGEEARARLKQRVAALDAAEAARRFQAESLGLHNEQAGPAPDMGRFVEQLTGRVRGPHLLPPPRLYFTVWLRADLTVEVRQW